MSFSANEVDTTNSAVFIDILDTQVHFNQPLIDKLWVVQRQCVKGHTSAFWIVGVVIATWHHTIIGHPACGQE